MDSLVVRYLAERHRRGDFTLDTFRNVRCHLLGLSRSFAGRPLDRFGPRALDHWLETIGHLSPASRRSHVSSVRGFSLWLLRTNQVASDPTRLLKPIRQPRSVPRALAAMDVARVLIAAPDSRARCIVTLMVGLGLRCGEVSHLEVSDYDQSKCTLLAKGKGGHERLLPVPPEAAVVIDDYLAEAGYVGGPLIRSRRRGATTSPLRPDTISRLVGAWMAEAGIKRRARDGVSAHAFRHTAASDVLDRCGDLRVVQEMLGHRHLATTAIYLRRANVAQLRSAMGGRDYLAARPCGPVQPSLPFG